MKKILSKPAYVIGLAVMLLLIVVGLWMYFSQDRKRTSFQEKILSMSALSQQLAHNTA